MKVFEALSLNRDVGRPIHRYGRAMSLAAVAVGVCAVEVFGQARQVPAQRVQRVPVQRAPAQRVPAANGRMMSGEAPPAVLIEPSAPIVNLLDKADDAALRRDWKLVVDSLQRVIEHPERSLVFRESPELGVQVLYQSVRRVAIAKLARAGEEALAAYRLLYDGKAKGLLRRATEAHDLALLQVLVDRYLLTSHGDDASILLAAWLVDEGRPADALAVLDDMAEMVPDADVDRSRVAVLRAISLALLERTDEASRALADVGASAGVSAVKSLLDEPGALSAARATARLPERTWPCVGGGPGRLGHMPPVAPTLQGAIPWRYDFDFADNRSWRPTVTDDPAGPLAEPPGDMAVVGDSVFLRTVDRCTALHVDTLQPRWEVSFDARTPRDPANTTVRVGQITEPYEEDFAAWSVAAGHGNLYVLQRSERRNSGAGFIRFRGGARRIPGEYPTWLVAIDQATGRVRWEVGRREEVPDPRANIEVRALPVMAGDKLWLPVQRQRDLYLMALSPKDGAFLQEVLLCTLPTPGAPVWMSLTPAYSSGTIFVPTGEGVLVAVSAEDGTLRWAHQFMSSERDYTSPLRMRPPHRLMSTPIVAGGKVIHAPVESPEILAFSTSTGEMQWRAGMDGCAYLVGVADGRVYLGGRMLAAHDLVTGKRVWSTEIKGAPTGRTILSGDALYTPTWEGLVAVDAATGERSGFEALPFNQPPLGNLLCVSNAMFAYDPNSVRRFPDVRRAYPDALAAYEANPGEAEPAVRLAWMELLRGQPDAALAVVDTIGDPVELRGGVKQDASRVMVESLLALAARPEIGDDESLDLLRRADKVAMTFRQRVRARLAYGEHLQSMGRGDEAYRLWLQMALMPETEDATVYTGQVLASTRLELKRRLRELGQRLTPDQQGKIKAEIETQIESLVSQIVGESAPLPVVDRLEVFSELELVSESTLPAMNALAGLRMMQRRYEQAEQYAREAMRRADDLEQRVDANLQLYETYIGAQDVAGPGHRRILQDLAREYGDEAIPGTAITVSDWVANERERLSMTGQYARVATGPFDFARQARGLTGDIAWAPIISRQNTTGVLTQSRTWSGSATVEGLVTVEGRNVAALQDRILTIDIEDTVHCRDLYNGTLLWQATLSLPRPPQDEGDATPIWRGAANLSALADGQTLILRGPEGLHAVGMLTGKRIWTIPYRDIDLTEAQYRERIPLAMGDGWIVAGVWGGSLTKFRVRDADVVWERELRGEKVGEIRVLGDKIMIIDPRQQRTHLLSSADGEVLQRVVFRQPDIEGVLVDIVTTEGVLCGPTADGDGDGIAAYSIDNGALLWEADLERPMTQIFRAAPGVVAVGMLGGQMRVFRASDGEVLFDQNIKGMQRVVDGVWRDDVFVIRHCASLASAAVLTAVDPRDGSRIWSVGGLVAREELEQPLQVVGDMVLAVILRGGRVAGGSTMWLATLDIHTGQDVGNAVDLLSRPRRHWRNVSIQPYEDSIVVSTPDAVFNWVLGTRKEREADSGS